MNKKIILNGWPYALFSFIFLFLSSSYQNDSDAIYYLYCIQKGVLGGATGHPVFFYIHWALFKVFSVLGFSIHTYARLGAFLTGCLFVYLYQQLLSVLLQKTISKPPKTSEILKILLLFSTPVFIYQAVVFQVYILATVFVILAHLSALSSTEENKAFYLFPLWCVLSLFTHLNTVFFILPLMLWFLMQHRKSLGQICLSLLLGVFFCAGMITPLLLINPDLKILIETLLPAGQVYFFNFNPVLFLKTGLFVFLAAGLNLGLLVFILLKSPWFKKIKKEYQFYYLLLFLALFGQILLYATSSKVDFIRHAFILSTFAATLSILFFPKRFQKSILIVTIGLTFFSAITLKIFLSVKDDVLKQTFTLVQKFVPTHSALIIDTPDISYYPFYTYLSDQYDLYVKQSQPNQTVQYLTLVKKGYLLNEEALSLPVIEEKKKIFVLTNLSETQKSRLQKITFQKIVFESIFVKVISLYHRPHSWYKELYLYQLKG